MRVKIATLASGILISGLASGPIFVLAMLLIHMGPALLRPEFSLEVIVLMMVLFVVSIFPGGLVGLTVGGLSGSLMALLGSRFPLARSRIVWTLAGSGIGLLLMKLTGATDDWGAALLITSTACAWLTRRRVEWEG